VRKANEGEDVDAIKEKTEALSKTVQKIGEHMAKTGSGGDSKPSEEPAQGSEGNKASGG
jgi:hypothetical protein